MLKRRPSKRFVLAGTGEEGAWDTSKDGSVDDSTGATAVMTTITTSSSMGSDLNKISDKPMDLLSVKTELKTGMK
jgi:hypothetical protein